jgi:hypothetical protein
MIQKRMPFFPLVLFTLLSLLITSQIFAQSVNVKMRINTSTCLDTLTTNHIIYLCGETTNTNGTVPAITWDPTTTGIIAVNVGGDYWEAEFQADAGDEIRYKFVAYFDGATSTFHWDGWEGPIDAGFDSGDNRALTVGANDTTLAIQYFNGWEDKVGQFEKPFESKK